MPGKAEPPSHLKTFMAVHVTHYRVPDNKIAGHNMHVLLKKNVECLERKRRSLLEFLITESLD